MILTPTREALRRVHAELEREYDELAHRERLEERVAAYSATERLK